MLQHTIGVPMVCQVRGKDTATWKRLYIHMINSFGTKIEMKLLAKEKAMITV